MMRSMTGFGHAQRNIGGTEYAVEIRSVNSRHFKAIIRLPELWSSFETDIERRLNARLRRGTIHLALRMKSPSSDVAYRINTAALERYMEQLELLRPDQTDLQMRVDLGNLLLLPGACIPPEPDDVVAGARPEMRTLIDEAIANVLAMRTEEGKTIAADLQSNCDVIEARLVEIADRAPKVTEEYHRRLKQRVEELTRSAELTLDEQDLAREVAVFAERCDIAEEVSRLRSHLSQFRVALKEEEQPGRKLDFIAQEMLREANTVAAKASDAQIARAVVEVKTAVDRIKEQVQNVE